MRKKLEERGIAGTTSLEDDIKDLAGCRAIFYTNNDVSTFISSGIVHQNFEVLEVKLHQPRRETEDAAELYISNHYLIRLRPERLALPEYARFAGMRCEIQIQTILNHAWAEMAHDTIYKAPELGDFGGKQFDGIKSRMQKVARKYLLPAGYEFQKIANDFQRLIEGKALFDGNALDAIVEAADNNIRAQALETFSENVLPLYDDVQAVYPEIIERLVAAAGRARTTPPVLIETPYGALPAKTYRDIVVAIAALLGQYRYVDIEATFDALCTLYGSAENEEERKPLLELGRQLAEHQMQIWQLHGPVVQTILVERMEKFDQQTCRALSPLLTAMLGEILGTEISGTTSSSTTVTFHRGTVVASGALGVVRTKATNLLKRLFTLIESEQERHPVLLALQAAMRPAYSAGNALARMVMNDTLTVLDFLTQIAPTLSLQRLQATEDRVHDCFWWHEKLPEMMRDDADLDSARAHVQAAALAFRNAANANHDFVIYKVLVGFNSVFPPAWDDKEFQYEQAKEYRAEQVEALLASVEAANAEDWFERICHYAQTESNDAATFPVFGNFLERLAAAQPAIVLGFLDRLESPLASFIPGMLSGLVRSAESTQALERIDAWLNAGEHIEQVAWYLRFADPFDESLLCRTLDSAIEHSNSIGMRNVLIAAVDQFTTHPGALIEQIFLPALRRLEVDGDFSWVRMPWFSWLEKPIIRALDEEQARAVLHALISYPEIEYGAEYIAATIASRWPSSVVAFMGERQAFARTNAVPPRYRAIPFEVHQLKQPLAAAPELMLEEARHWFDHSPQHFTYDGGRLLASVFPGLSDGLEALLAALVEGGEPQDFSFVLAVLAAYEGKSCVYGLVRAIVAALDPKSELQDEARSVLSVTGFVRGEFGFADLYTEQKGLLKDWLNDSNENVRHFAAQQIQELDRRIAAANRSAEASIAMRKLEYGEELGTGDE